VYERIHEEGFAVERVHFKKTKKRVNPKKAPPFIILEGRIPVLVSAPHSVRQVREGKIKRSDENTGSLAFLLNRETSCHTIAVKKLYGGDPNWDERCLYKERLRGLVEANGIRLVLDLHGAARESEFDIDLGTINGESLVGDKVAVNILKESFQAEGIGRIADNVFTAKAQHTVTRFCSEELGVPSIQLEINHRYRAPNRNGEDYSRLFRALATAIKDITTT
jgi:hypothetical protein